MSYHHKSVHHSKALNKQEMLSGEITVLGSGEVDIKLTKERPSAVIVEFQDCENEVPCNHHNDKISWEVLFPHDKFIVKIKWDVSSAREIVWAVSF